MRLLPLALAAAVVAAQKKSTLFWAEQSKCEKLVCGALAEDERKNCVFKCIAPNCFDEFLAGDPLEDGQVDDPRVMRYNACAAFKFRVKDPSWDGEKNVSPEERQLPDSNWVAKPNASGLAS